MVGQVVSSINITFLTQFGIDATLGLCCWVQGAIGLGSDKDRDPLNELTTKGTSSKVMMIFI